jgi:tubulin-specific chaperone E
MGVPPYAALGKRIETHDGARATVRWVGSVQGQDGVWVGVEWDDPTRGKHDGSHDGKRYFDCTNASDSEAGTHQPASFLRVHKIKPSISFAAAIKRKYLDGKGAVSMKGGGKGPDDTETEADEKRAYVQSANGRKIEIELCLKKDEDPIAALLALDRLYLPDEQVADAGPPGEAARCGVAADALKILDLGGNLFCDWHSIKRFGEEFVNLEELDLTGVRAVWPTTQLPTPSPFANLTRLLLNKSQCSWVSARRIAANITSLKQLSVAHCGIETLDKDLSGLKMLDGLNLEGNDLEDWGEIEKLSKLKNLKRLHLGGNKIRSVRYPETHTEENNTKAFVPFQSLVGLFLADNAIEDWESIDCLDNFPNLTEVRVSGNPVVESAATRHEIVARVSRLTQLNGSLIADQERKDAEIRYLRRVLGLVKTSELAKDGKEVDVVSKDGGGTAEEDAPPSDAASAVPSTRAAQTGSEAVAANHPRLKALLGSYGELSVSVSRKTGDGTMGDDLIEVTLVCVAASAGEKAPVTKKVPASLSVAKLKLLCEKLFKVSVHKQKLFHKDVDAAHPELLEPDDYDVAYLGVKDGSRVLVEEADE